MNQHEIMGTYIVQLNDACEVKIGKVTLRKRHVRAGEVTFHSIPTIHLPSIITPKDIMQRKTINLNQIDLGNLQFLTHALKSESAVITSDEQFVNTHSVSLGTVIIYVILLIVIFIALY